MTTATPRTKNSSPGLTLKSATAADLMTPNPVSIWGGATLREALALLTDKGYSAAPVINEAGLPIGVLSRSDILVHDRETVAYAKVPAYYEEEPILANGERLREGFQVELPDPTLVSDLMTPVVFSVAPEAPADQVVRDMLSLRVHRLFVVDRQGVLIGVISSLDVLRHLS